MSPRSNDCAQSLPQAGSRSISDEQWAWLLRTRATDPGSVQERFRERRRRRPDAVSDPGMLCLVAGDQPARGALRVGTDALRMAHRRTFLERLVAALSQPEVDGVVGAADIIEDLLLLGALEGKVVLGSMNHGGLDGTAWATDDRFTGYGADGIRAHRLDGGKIRLCIDDCEPRVAATLESCARAVTSLAEHGLITLVEPWPCARSADDLLVGRQEPASLARAVSVASALGTTSASTWLAVPACKEPETVFGATTLPCLVVGELPSADRDELLLDWERAIRQPVVRGLLVGSAFLYPLGGGVDEAASSVVHLLGAK